MDRNYSAPSPSHGQEAPTASPAPEMGSNQARTAALGLAPAGPRFGDDPAEVWKWLHQDEDEVVPFQAQMEAAFGEDFSSVEVATGDSDVADVGANATAEGESIAFAEADPDPELVAHELAHVVQQRHATSPEEGVSAPTDAAEVEADAVAERAAAGEPVAVHAAPTATLQRDAVDDESTLDELYGYYETASEYAEDTYDTAAAYADATYDSAAAYATSGYETVSGYAEAAYDDGCSYATGDAAPESIPAPEESPTAPATEASGEEKDPKTVKPIDPANHQSRSSFVKSTVQENGITTGILDAIWPYYSKDDLVIGGFLNDSQQVWKVNYHWELVVWTCDAAQSVDIAPEHKQTFASIATSLRSCSPDPASGYLDDSQMSLADQTTPDQFATRYEVLKQAKIDLKTVVAASGVMDKVTGSTNERFLLAQQPVLAPGANNRHGTGYAVDIKGDNSGIVTTSRSLGATTTFDEQFHVHVEFASGVQGAEPA